MFLCCPQLLFLSKPFLWEFKGCLWSIAQSLAGAPKMVQIGPICQAGGGQMDTNRSLNGLDLAKMIKVNHNDLRAWYSNGPFITLNGRWLQSICVIWNLHNPMEKRKKRVNGILRWSSLQVPWRQRFPSLLTKSEDSRTVSCHVGDPGDWTPFQKFVGLFNIWLQSS